MPHLHAPIMPGRNVIYSAGFQLMWNAMWDRFTKEAPKLAPVSDLAPLLNLRGIEEADLSPGSVSVTCGYVHEGVVERIQREMEEEENGVAGRDLDFTRPFLLLLNERKSGKTVFAAWIGNAELLEAAPEPELAPISPGGNAGDDDDPFAEP